MSHVVAGIDVHKKMLAVVLVDAAEQELQFQRRKFGTRDSDLRVLATWLAELGAQEVVMESTAQYWKPVWQRLEGQCHLELAQAQSNRGPRGRKSDFKDAERLVRRYLADELILSFVPDPEQRLWRSLSRTKVSDLLGVSARRMLRAIADGEKDVECLAGMADPNLRASQEQLCDALRSVSTIDPRYRTLLKQFLDQVELQERHIRELDKQLAESLKEHADGVEGLVRERRSRRKNPAATARLRATLPCAGF